MGFRLVRGASLSALAVVLCALVAPRLAHADDEADEEPHDQVSEERCELGSGRIGKLVTDQEPQTCGRYCAQTTTFTVEDKDGTALLSLTNNDFTGPLSEEDGARPLVSVRCERKTVFVSLESGDEPALAFRWEPNAHRLRLAHTAAVQRALVTTPLSGDEAERRGRVRDLARAVLEGLPAPDPNTGTHVEVGGIDQAFVDGLTLGTARDALEAGAWERAQKIIADVSASLPATGTARASLALSQQVARLREELSDRRKNSQPVQALGRSRLGTLKKVQALPIDPGVSPTLFWRRGEVCVVQEDASRTMRCYAPETRHWGPLQAVDVPTSSGRDLKLVEISSWGIESCMAGSRLSMVVRKDIPDNSVNPCQQSPGSELEDVLAVVDGNVLLRVGFQLDRGGLSGEPLSVAAANAAFARSGGGLLAGNGTLRFLRDGRLARVADDGEQRWDVLGAPPAREAWAAPPLVSPDQRWVVAQSELAGSATLWLFALSRSTTP